MFCNHCGGPLQAGSAFCPSCGTPVVQIAKPPEPSRLARHLRLLGVFWLVLSGLRLLGGGTRLAGARFLRHIGDSWFDETFLAWPLGSFLPPILTAKAGWMFLIGIAGIAAGLGLMERRSWARMLALVLACLALLDPLLGTALGIYTLWVLLPADSEREYRLGPTSR